MKPRILFIGTSCPFGDISGAGVRTRNVLRLLERCGDVTAVFATGLEWTDEQLGKTRDAFDVALVSRYVKTPVSNLDERRRKIFDPEFLNTNGVAVPPEDRQRVEELMEQHDLVWLHTLKLANAFRRYHWPRSVMDVDDFPSRFHRLAAWHPLSVKNFVRRTRLSYSWRRHESKCPERFDLLTVCKEQDRDAFGDPSRVRVVPNGFEVPDAAPAGVVREKNRLGMIGDFNFLPNHNGLRWFMREVWSRVRAAVPDAELRLVGKASREIAEEFPNAGVSGHGYVPDVAAEMASWSCMIVPTRLGGGTHLKVAEGLARRVPIVMTTHGARGYDVKAGVHACIADEAAGFAEGCVSLLRDQAVGTRMSAAGWELFNERYSWDSIGPAVERTVADCLERIRQAR